MASKAKSKQEEALAFLDDLDNMAPPPSAGSAPTSQPPPEGEAEVYAFIDEITQKSSEPPRTTLTGLDRLPSRAGTPTLRKSTERVKVGATTPLLPNASGSVTPLSASPMARPDSAGSRISIPTSARPDASAHSPSPAATPPANTSGGWGWGSVWSTASSAIQQAKTVVDEQVKNLPKNEQARKWGEGVLEYAKAAQLDKLSKYSIESQLIPGSILRLGQDFRRVGLSTLTDLLNVVAPPISEHEVIQVWLSHDMRGYEGVESLVYRALARVCAQSHLYSVVISCCCIRSWSKSKGETWSSTEATNLVLKMT